MSKRFTNITQSKTQYILLLKTTIIGIFILQACTAKNEMQYSTFTLEIQENCTDSLALYSSNLGSYYHCGIGVTFDIKYEDKTKELAVEIYDFEVQYKPSEKIPIARFNFKKDESNLLLNSIEYLHENYKGEFRYLEYKIRTAKYIKI